MGSDELMSIGEQGAGEARGLTRWSADWAQATGARASRKARKNSMV